MLDTEELPPARPGYIRADLAAALRVVALEAQVKSLQGKLDELERWKRKAVRYAHLAARRNGMCGVFDQVMRSVDMPDRNMVHFCEVEGCKRCETNADDGLDPDA